MRDIDVDYINAPLDCLADWKLLADEYIRQQSFAEPITSFVPAISVEFTVYGRPQQRGSKTPWIPRYKGGSMVMKGGKPVIARMDSNKKSKPWVSQVQAAAYESMLGRDLLMGAIALSVANVATLFPDQTLEFDPVERQVVNLDAANEAVAPEYRKGWSL